MNVFLLLLVAGTSVLCQDYYWRDYTGTIPWDAVVGGTGVNGNYVYIGQAFVGQYGLITSQINPGDKSVDAPIHGIVKVNDHIKILCGPQRNFVWIPANATNLRDALIGRVAVIGGHEEDLGNYCVGRLIVNGKVIIGKIDGVWTIPVWADNALFYYSNNGVLASATDYQVLVYENKSGLCVVRFC